MRGNFSGGHSPQHIFPSLLFVIALLGASIVHSGRAWASALVPTKEDYQKIDQMMDGYPLLRNESGKPILLKRSADVREIQYDTETEKQFGFMRDYGYISYLVESGQLDEAEKAFANQPDRLQWPLSLALLEARLQLTQKKFDQAQQRLEALAIRHPENIDTILMMATIWQEQDKTAEAIAALEKGRKIAPKNTEVLEELGKLYSEQMKKSTSHGERNKVMEKMEEVYDTIVEILPGRSTVPYLYALAYIKQEKQKLPEAVKYLTRIIQLDPRRTEIRLQLAQFQRSLGDKEASLDILKQAFLFDPSDAEVAKALDLAIKDTGKSAAGFYKAMADEYPGRDPIQIHYARILLGEEKLAEATKVLKSTLDLHPHNELAWLLLAGVHSQEKKTEQSREALQKYIEYAADRPSALAKAARLLLAFGTANEAAKYVEELRQIQPDHPDLADMSLEVNFAKGDHEKALQLIQQAVAANPGDLSRYPMMIQTLSQLNRLNEAIEPLKKARTQVQGEAWTAITAQLVDIHQKIGQLAEAEVVLKEAIAKEPKNAEWQIALARLYKMRKEPKKAEAIIAGILQSNAKDAAIIHDVGALKWELGQHAEGEKLIRQAIQISPDTPDFYNTLGYFFSEQKIRLDEALQLVQKALKLSPGKGYIIDSLGWIYFQKGDYQKAVTALEEAAEKEGDDPTVQSHLGQAYLKIGRREDALKMLKSALKNSHDEDESNQIRQHLEIIEKKQGNKGAK